MTQEVLSVSDLLRKHFKEAGQAEVPKKGLGFRVQYFFAESSRDGATSLDVNSAFPSESPPRISKSSRPPSIKYSQNVITYQGGSG